MFLRGQLGSCTIRATTKRCSNRKLGEFKISLTGVQAHKRLFHSSFYFNLPNSKPKVDPWQALGVKRGDSLADIKKAYTKLVKQYHPDAQKEKDTADSSKFVEIQQAFEYLSENVTDSGEEVTTTSRTEKSAAEEEREKREQNEFKKKAWQENRRKEKMDVIMDAQQETNRSLKELLIIWLFVIIVCHLLDFYQFSGYRADHSYGNPEQLANDYQKLVEKGEIKGFIPRSKGFIARLFSGN